MLLQDNKDTVTMHYLNRLINAGVYTEAQSIVFSVVGILMWSGTLAAYLWLWMTLSDDENTIASNFMVGILANHGAVLVLTMFDAFGPAGKSIVLQTIVTDDDIAMRCG